MIDWYDKRDQLRQGDVFLLQDGNRVMLERRVPEDGSAWYVADWWNNSWAYMYSRIEPGDLKEKIED